MCLKNQVELMSIENSDWFIYFYFEHKCSLSLLSNKIIYSNLVYFLIKQGQASLRVTWLINLLFPII